MSSSNTADGITQVFVVSGGPGATGRLLLDTLLAQFPEAEVHVTYFKDLRSPEQLEQVLLRAKAENALIIHSLVDTHLRAKLAQRTEELRLETHDVFGQLLQQLERRLGRDPLASPGRYHALRRDYYERIEAIEFAIEHDDSQNLHSIHLADIVLVGVSRTGKTPLSMYLAMRGWKTANVSFIPDIPWPTELGSVNHGRIIGLSIDRERLLAHRKQRSAEVGLGRSTPYNSEEALYFELEALHSAFKEHRLPIIDVTEKPLETTAHEVLQLINRNLGDLARRGRVT